MATGKGGDPRPKGASGNPGEALAVGIERLTAYIVHEASQQHFEFVRDVSVPSHTQAVRDALQVLSALLEREASLIRAVHALREDLVKRPDPAAADDSADVAERLSAIEQELSCLEPVMEENKKLRQRDFQFGFVGPFATSVIRVVDGLECDLRALDEAAEKAATERELKLCRGMSRRVDVRREELLAVLGLLAIEPFATEVMQPLDGTRHRVVDGEVPRKSEQAGRIAKHLRPGYWRRADAWVVRPEWVTVYLNRVVND